MALKANEKEEIWGWPFELTEKREKLPILEEKESKTERGKGKRKEKKE